MQIIQINIHSFGKWIDKIINLDDQTRFNSFYGQNESGKSTVQKFILYMLFGLSKKECEFYRPRNRAHISGEMTLKDGETTITLSRQNTDLTVYLSDGQSKNEAWWLSKLKGMNRKTYESIYAFAANDLIHIQDMKQEDLSEILISVGLTGSTALYDAEKKLTAALRKVYLPTGRKPELNQKQIAYEEMERDYQVEAAKEAQYHQYVTQLADEEATLEAKNEVIQTERKQLQAINIKKQYFSEIESYYLKQEALKAYQEAPKFPEDGISRWDNLEKEKMPLQVEFDAINDSIDQLKQTLENDQAKAYSSDQLNDLEQLQAEEGKYYQDKNQYEDNAKQAYEQANLKNQLLADLNWQTDHPAAKALTFNLEEKWQKLIQDKKQVTERTAELEAERQDLNQKLQSKADMIDTKESNLLSREKEIELENKVASAKAKSGSKQITSASPFLYTSYFMMTIAVLVAIVAIIIPATFLLFIAGLLLAAGAYLFWQTKKINIPHDREAEQEQNELQYAEERLDKQKMLDKELTLLHAQRDAQIKQSQEVLMKLEQMRGQDDLLEAEISKEKERHPYLDDFPLEDWVAVYRKVASLNEINLEIEKLNQVQTKLKENLANIEEALNEKEGVTDFSSLNQVLKKQALLQENIEITEEKLKSQSQRCDELKVKILQLTDKQKTLLDYAEAETEEGFRQKAEIYSTYQALKEDLAKVTIKLSSIFDDEAMKEFSNQVIEKVALDDAAHQLESTIKDMETEQEDLRKSMAALNAEINHLEKQEDLAILNFKKQIALDEINETAKAWAINRTELNIIQRAKQKYQEKYLGKVITLTSNYFSKMTKGNYQNVFAPTETEQFQVEDKTHIRYNVDELSQGTVDQLYVALRLAIAKVMHDTHPLPILVDDAFVHFDDQRLEEGLELLQGAADIQQVLFFTCKQSISQKLNSQYLLTAN